MDSLETLDKSLDNLEDVLAPLLSKSLPETLDRLDVLQKAKLQVLLPYVVNDLVFIYLKTRGINPKTHPVVGELDRIKQYFDKIKNAEDPEKRRFAVDQGAATRFIKHAQANDPPSRYKRRRTMDPWAGYDESTSGAPSPKDKPTDKRRPKRAKMNNSLPVDANDETPQTNGTTVATRILSQEQDLATGAVTGSSKSKKKNRTETEIIDVDALSSKTSGSHEGPTKSKTIQDIHVDFMDSSRSGMPAQEKKSKKKKKKKKTAP